MNKLLNALIDARDYILTGPVDSYERFGFGLYLTLLKESGVQLESAGC